MKIELTEENVLLAGRTYKEGDTLWLALSGTGASFIYTGKKLFITVVGSPVINHEDAENNCAHIAVYVNGERKVDDMVTQAEQTYTVWESDVAETVEVKIIKLSESAMSVVGVKDLEIAEGERVVPAAKKEHLRILLYVVIMGGTKGEEGKRMREICRSKAESDRSLPLLYDLRNYLVTTT